ncbi:MAG TPA: hypothetical protein VJT82_02780, partial [Pyrinomonadaceae bacterium]|nr:hypothetical protein [Pyrinomonadaceae bacterium]
MNDKRWYETLIENTPLAIILVGVFLFFVAAAGGLPSQQITIVGWWRVTLAIMGIISAASGVLLYWVERHKANGIERGAIPVTPSDASSASTIAEQPAIGSPIEGKYYAEGDVTYVN